MEVAALAGLLGLGYMLTLPKTSTVPVTVTEGFATRESSTPLFANGGQPPPLYPEDKTPPGHRTIPGLPRQPNTTIDTQNSDHARSLLFASPPSIPHDQATPHLYMSTNNQQQQDPDPEYSESGPSSSSSSNSNPWISPLTGIAMGVDEFTHANMVPFQRGAPKQNIQPDANRSVLDNMVGAGSLDIGKREQGPLFNPHREPTGNVFGFESVTSFMQDRMVAPMNRANERPMEAVRVGPGVGEGYSAVGAGGFQQFEAQEIARSRYMSVDDTRTASNPKLSYEGVMNAGAAINPMRGELGEVRKYRPDTFFLNETGERNFVTVGENTKPMVHSTQVLKFQSREETSTEAFGPAQSTDFSATYTVPSFKAPNGYQHEGTGFRHADGSAYGVADTDAVNNDFGRDGIELPVNQRNVTGERGQTLNLSGPAAQTVYEQDVARTTVRESTGANDRVGVAGAVGAKKLIVYDPMDMPSIPNREVTGPNSRFGAGGVAAVGAQKMTVYDPTDIARTTVRETTGATEFVGIAGAVGAKKLTVYDPTDLPRATTRNTLESVDTAMNVTRIGGGAAVLAFPDGMRPTTKASVSANSAYSGSAGPATFSAEQVYDTAYAMRTNPTKEVVASGRRPVAGNGSLETFNGQDYTNLSFRQPASDSLNDRENTTDRVMGATMGVEALGLQRPKDILQMDVSRDRNIHEILDTLNDNPYALPIHKIAQGVPLRRSGAGSAEGALMGISAGIPGW